MRKSIMKIATHSEVFVSSFFQKLPELMILLAIPTVLVAYIFVRPEFLQDKKASMQQTNIGDSYSSEKENQDIDADLRALMNDVTKDMTQGSGSASLLENTSTGSAQTDKLMPKLDLVGPWSCESGSVNGEKKKLYIDNKSIKLISQSASATMHYLVKDGCAYSWINNGSGKKQCSGISEMLAMAEFASQSGLFDIETMINELGGQSAGNLKSLASSCIKTTTNSALFTLPQGIKWVEDEVIINDNSSNK